jgi:hypothetical protein
MLNPTLVSVLLASSAIFIGFVYEAAHFIGWLTR